MIRNRETLIPLTELARKLDGGPYCPHTILMWCRKGKLRNSRNPSSGRVRLERVRAGRGWATSMEAYWRFIASLNQES